MSPAIFFTARRRIRLTKGRRMENSIKIARGEEKEKWRGGVFLLQEEFQLRNPGEGGRNKSSSFSPSGFDTKRDQEYIKRLIDMHTHHENDRGLDSCFSTAICRSKRCPAFCTLSCADTTVLPILSSNYPSGKGWISACTSSRKLRPDVFIETIDKSYGEWSLSQRET